MKLEIRSFADSGDLDHERVTFRALEDMDIGEYLVLRSNKGSEGGPISGAKDAYWFPDQMVKEGDLIILYTKKGARSKKLLESGKTAHFFYWRHDRPFWGSEPDNVVVLMLATEWVHKTPR
jgi:hypothetical protein